MGVISRSTAVGWNENFELGVETLDHQHKELLVRIGALIDAMHETRGADYIAGFIDFLARYIAEHLATEEALMVRHEYPGTERHLEEHRLLKESFQSFRERLLQEGASPTLAMEVHDKICTWLFRHELETDRQLAYFLKTRSLPDAADSARGRRQAQ